VSDHRAEHRVATLCRVLGVSSSGYWAWCRRAPSARAQEDQRLLRLIRTAHAASRGTYGAPRIQRELRAQGVHVSRKRIARLMREAGLVGATRRRFVTTTVRDEHSRPAPDLVKRAFVAGRPNHLWVADITYIPRVVLGKRLGRFGLTLHPDKTRLLPFRRPPAGQTSGKGLAAFDFLGFTFYWARSRRGRWWITCKTRGASLRRAIGSVTEWCRRYRHHPVRVQHAALTRRLRGHFNSFGVSGNFRSLLLLVEATRRAWYKWLCRRSQRTRLTWERFADLLEQHPLPRPRITVRIWGP
jgi:hypothetical protein